MTDQLQVENVCVAFGRNEIVHQASLAIENSQIGCLIGPSGGGKTTLLRAIAGFEPVTGGTICIGGREVSRPGWTLAPELRRVGMVFQDFALFPHLTVAGNISFGLQGRSGQVKEQRVNQLLELVGMASQREAWPHQLSGGQQQRVALARAMAPRPDILLLDEPFSSIDVELREQLAREVRSILREDGITAILVTHDQYEAFATADMIGVLQDGRLAQWDTGYNLYHRPADRFVADFIGQGAMLHGHVNDNGLIETELGNVEYPGHDLAAGTAIDILIRPDDVTLTPAPGALQVTITDKIFRGEEYLYRMRLPSGNEIMSVMPSHADFSTGDTAGIELHIDHIVLFEQHPV